MQIAVRSEQVGTNRETENDASVLEGDRLDAEERGKRSLRRRVESVRVYLPVCDETYVATALICAALSTLLKAGMIAPPFVTCFCTRANGGLS